MSDVVESTGTTVDEAVSEALLQMGARKDEVEIKVLDEGRNGFLGIFGGRPARVQITRKAGGETRSRRGGRSRRSGRSEMPDTRRGDRPASAKTEKRPSTEKQESRPRRGGARPARDGDSRNDGRSDGGRRGRGRGPGKDGPRRDDHRDQPSAAADAGRSAPVERTTPANRAPEAARVEETRVIAEPVAALTKVEALRDVAPENMPQALEDIAAKVMSLSSFSCRVNVAEEEYMQVRIIADDESAGVLIGRHGSTIDAVEHLVERMGSQAAGDRVRMNLDINNYRRRRTAILKERVQEMMDRVIETGKDMRMEPLCARERRLAHLEVADDPQLRTYTLSSAGGKFVVIAPARDGESPEADEAPEAPADRGDD